MKLRKYYFCNTAALIAGLVLVATVAPCRAQGQTNTPSPGATASGAASAPSATDTPAIPVDTIIKGFAQHESEFKLARENYTYSQSVLVEDVAPSSGEYQLESEIVFTPQGKRYEEVTYAPQATLQDFSLSPEDMKDLEDIQPFVLTAEELPKYDVKYMGREKVDEINAYVFSVAPKRMEKGQRYFQGTVWVDDHDLAIVKSDGKAVPDLKDNLFPRFVTYRENIEANFWFPTYTHADDVLHFRNGDVHMRMTVRYKNYKRFGATIKLGESKTIDVPASPPTAPQTAPKK